MTRQAIDGLLDAVQVSAGTKLLDVATRQGCVAAKATTRGANAIGVDITENMVAEARRRFPGTTFEIGDAEQLGCAGTAGVGTELPTSALQRFRPESDG